jgi:hypothetical protein
VFLAPKMVGGGKRNSTEIEPHGFQQQMIHFLTHKLLDKSLIFLTKRWVSKKLTFPCLVIKIYNKLYRMSHCNDI